MSNTALWDQVFMTDPKAVKAITGKPYKGNSPAPYWIIKRATEVFGPVGIGWGVNVKSEQYIHIGEHDVLHSCIVQVWFMQNGVRSETFEQAGGTKAAYMTGAGKLMVDEDAAKKSVTDAMVKCMSMIGFAGDIFSGRWDDSKYVEQANEHFRDSERQQARAEWMDNQAHRLEACETIAELGLAWTDMYKVMKAEGDQEAIDLLTTIKDRMKATIEENTK